MDPKEMSDKVEKALNEVLSEFEDYEEGDILVDWVVVCFSTNPDSEKGDAYPMLYSNGIIPKYRARGLLKTGLMQLTLDDLVEDE